MALGKWPSLLTQPLVHSTAGRSGWTSRNITDSSAEEHQWELYNTEKDFSQANNLAVKQNPTKLEKLQELWSSESEEIQCSALGIRRK